MTPALREHGLWRGQRASWEDGLCPATRTLTEPRQQAQQCVLIPLLGDVQHVVEPHLAGHALLLQEPAPQRCQPPGARQPGPAPALPAALLGEALRQRVWVCDRGLLLGWELLIHVEGVVIHHKGHEHGQESGDQLHLLGSRPKSCRKPCLPATHPLTIPSRGPGTSKPLVKEPA